MNNTVRIDNKHVAIFHNVDLKEISVPDKFDNPPFYCEHCNRFYYPDQLLTVDEPYYNENGHIAFSHSYQVCPYCKLEISETDNYVF